MAQRYHIYVQFAPDGNNHSREPRKWWRALTSGDPKSLNLPGQIEAVGCSECGTSLNLEVMLDPANLAEELKRMKSAFPGSPQVGIYIPKDATPALTRLKPADIIPFPRAQVA